MLEDMGLQVVGEADSGETALVMFERTKPDIVLLDIQLPGLDGIEVARSLFQGGHSPVVVLTSSREAQDYGTRLSSVSEAVFIGKTDLSAAALTKVIDQAR